MQVSNHQPSFKAIEFSDKSISALNKRLPDFRFELFLNNFEKAFGDKNFDVFLGTTQKSENRLEATIKYDNENKKYVKEGLFSYITNNPLNFIKKIQKQAKKDLSDITKNKK